jgi:hypothetical protein
VKPNESAAVRQEVTTPTTKAAESNDEQPKTKEISDGLGKAAPNQDAATPLAKDGKHESGGVANQDNPSQGISSTKQETATTTKDSTTPDVVVQEKPKPVVLNQAIIPQDIMTEKQADSEQIQSKPPDAPAAQVKEKPQALVLNQVNIPQEKDTSNVNQTEPHWETPSPVSEKERPKAVVLNQVTLPIRTEASAWQTKEDTPTEPSKEATIISPTNTGKRFMVQKVDESGITENPAAVVPSKTEYEEIEKKVVQSEQDKTPDDKSIAAKENSTETSDANGALTTDHSDGSQDHQQIGQYCIL